MPYRVVVLLVLALAAASPSAVLAGPQQDRTCRDLADEWLGSGSWAGQLDEDGFSVLSGCVEEAPGEWFHPEAADDPRLPDGPLLSADEAALVRPIDDEIDAQLADLDPVLPGWMAADLAALEAEATTDGRVEPGFGVEFTGQTVAFHDQYLTILNPYLGSPDRYELGSFAQWWWDRRQGAGAGVGADLHPTYAQVARLKLQLNRAPWPWDLADPVNRAMFFRWALDTGLVDAASPPTGSGRQAESAVAEENDCAAFAAWLGLTEERIRTVIDAWTALAKLESRGRPTDPTYWSTAATIRAAATEQRASNPPASARAVNALLAGAMDDIADAIDALTDADDSGELRIADARYEEALAAFREAQEILLDEEAACGL